MASPLVVADGLLCLGHKPFSGQGYIQQRNCKVPPPTERIDRIEDLLLRGEITLDQAKKLAGLPARGDGEYHLQPIEATEAEGEEE